MPPIIISDLRGGRNGADSVIDPGVPRNQCAEAKNIDFSQTALGRKRGGCDNLSVLGGTAFSNGVQWMTRHVPNGDETDAELWAMDGAGVVKRLRRGGGGWADVALADAITGNPYETAAFTFNGKLWLLYKSAQARSHLFDPLTNNVRRVGLAAPTAAPTRADFGAGAYAATTRYYRTRVVQLNGTIVIRRSEPSGAAASFAPSGAGASVIITLNGAPNEGETHWELEASPDNKTWYVINGQISGVTNGAIPIGNQCVDTTLTSAYSIVSDISGYYSLFPSVKFGITDNNAWIGAGSYDASTPNQSREWFSPVLGSADAGDDERWVSTLTQKNRIDLNESDGGNIIGLGGPVNGVFWAFKYRQIIRHVPTGDVTKPYLTRRLSYTTGAVNHWAICMGEDAIGNPAIYFISYNGIYRIGFGGTLEYMGRDVEDVWIGFNGYLGVNLGATVVGHCQYHAILGQVWFWIATGSNVIPDTLLVLDVNEAVRKDQFGVRGGWAIYDGPLAAAYCSAMFSNTISATATSHDLKPYIGRADTTIYKGDSTALSDNGTLIQGYIKTRSLLGDNGIDRLKSVSESYLIAQDQAGGVIRQTLIKDFDLESQVSDAVLDPSKQETNVIRKFDGSMSSDLGIIQVQLGDAQPASSAFALEALVVPVTDEGGR